MGSSSIDSYGVEARFLLWLRDAALPGGLQSRLIEEPRSAKRAPALDIPVKDPFITCNGMSNIGLRGGVVKLHEPRRNHSSAWSRLG